MRPIADIAKDLQSGAMTSRGLVEGALAKIEDPAGEGPRTFIRVFSEAADLRMDDPSLSWPAKLRVRGIHGARGVYEMTWSFSGPDGRATWEWVSLTDEAGERQVAVRWRRIGDHAIFARP